jgi:hypothetical protein
VTANIEDLTITFKQRYDEKGIADILGENKHVAGTVIERKQNIIWDNFIMV